MKQDTNIGSNILRVSASDEDADNNGAIRYSLTAPNDPADLDYFDIQPESGWIFLQKPLDVSWSFLLLLLIKFRQSSISVVLVLRHYKIATQTSIYVTKTDAYRVISDVQLFSSIYVIFDILRSISAGTNRDGYRGLPVMVITFCSKMTNGDVCEYTIEITSNVLWERGVWARIENLSAGHF